jgi:hypothetical protein
MVFDFGGNLKLHDISLRSTLSGGASALGVASDGGQPGRPGRGHRG